MDGRKQAVASQLQDRITTTSQLVGHTSSKTVPDDNQTITNVTFTYNGPDLNYSGTLD